MASFAGHQGASLIRASLIVGIVCNAEGLAMSTILPMWRRDVRSLFRAWRIRRETLDPRASQKARSLRIVNGAEKPASATSAAALRAQ
jgi:hypothetical protein